jgi:cellulose synthase/poly-beta-1,6-N-acetylglucosamine synthase-like glycosyltransferase
VKSRPDDNLISLYRASLYFIWQAMFKRLQNVFDAIAIAPGCSSTWRVSALRRIRFDHRMSTEDFHLSVATHRQRLGRIKYVPGAVVWTQDPHTLRAFVRQTYRWDRAWWEVVRAHRVGLLWLRRDQAGRIHFSGVDIVNALVILSMLAFFLRLLAIPILLALPIGAPAALYPGGREALPLHLGIQAALMIGAALAASIATGRLRMVILSPAIAALMLLEFINTLRALASVLHHTFPRRPGSDDTHSSAWASPERIQIATGLQDSRVLQVKSVSQGDAA